MNIAFAIPTLQMIAVGGLFIAVVSDIRRRIIMDRVVLMVGACGLLLRLLSPDEALWPSLAAAILVFLGLWALFSFGAIGGGDVKMISASTLLVPASHVVPLLLSIAVAGGVVACVYLSTRQVLVRAGANGHELKGPAFKSPAFKDSGIPVRGGSWFRSTMRRELARIAAGEPMPYALAILAGVAAQLLKGVS